MPPARPHGAPNVYPLHRGFIDRPNLNDAFAEALQIEERSTFEKVSDALGSRDALIGYLCFVAGSFFTLGMAYLWSLAL